MGGRRTVKHEKLIKFQAVDKHGSAIVPRSSTFFRQFDIFCAFYNYFVRANAAAVVQSQDQFHLIQNRHMLSYGEQIFITYFIKCSRSKSAVRRIVAIGQNPKN